MHRYFPHTDADIAQMLERCGVGTIDELYSDVPEELRLAKPYSLPPEQSEQEVRDFFDALGKKNADLICFAGNGVYDHYVPAAIPSVISRSEFLTAYTPYQPEISQGTLHYIFEYQTMMSRLTGLEISNASMYDGATATAEAVMMAVAHARKRNRVLVASTLNPKVRAVVDTYAHYHGIRVDTIAEENGACSRADLEAKLAQGDVAGVLVAQPNRYGIVEDYSGWADTCHEAKSLLIMNCVAADLAVLRTPGEWGADIACGDGQSLGIPMSYGGPYIGFLCATKALMRKMPGRIVGATTDAEGRRVFVLTLQAREQHIRREKATSNICSNQGLMSLYVTIYMSLLGGEGLREVCRRGNAGAHYLAKKLEETGLMVPMFPGREFLNEFAMTTSMPADALIDRCVDKGILPGVKIADNAILIAVTEMQTREQMDSFVEIVKSFA